MTELYQFSSMFAYVESLLPLILKENQDVPGLSVGLVCNYAVRGVCGGLSRSSTNEELTEDHYLQCASLSKTVGSAFAVEYFLSRGIDLSTSVNFLLQSMCRVQSPWRIRVNPASSLPESYADAVTLYMLMNHTALGMHYVYGIPLTEEFPNINDLLNGSYFSHYGYKELFLERLPGESFAYSGGGFVVLQHLLELLEGCPIEILLRPFLNENNMYGFTFEHQSIPGVKYAYGHRTRFDEVQPYAGGRLAFPPLAAGGLCTSTSLAQFISNLAKAYKDPEGCGGISHKTALRMLSPQHLEDKGAVSFIGAHVGLGVFVAMAGPNKIMLHQAANDGFRGVYFMVFDGPDAGKGAVILANGDNPAISLLCEISKLLLGPGVLNVEGIDFSKVQSKPFDTSGLKQEEIVNLGLKGLVIDAFINDINDRLDKEVEGSRTNWCSKL